MGHGLMGVATQKLVTSVGFGAKPRKDMEGLQLSLSLDLRPSVHFYEAKADAVPFRSCQHPQ